MCFSLPTNLTEQRVIKAVEVIPGNPEIVHHVLVYVDQNGTEVTDTIGGNCASPSSFNTKLVGGFTPGATPIIFPNQDQIKLGVTVDPGAKIYLNTTNVFLHDSDHSPFLYHDIHPVLF